MPIRNQRRHVALALGASLLGHAELLRAQILRGSMRRVGVLAPSTRAKEEITLKPFFDQMRELGWVEGQNIAYDWACADDRMALLPRLAAELVAGKPEVIYAPPTEAAVAVKGATQTIPIVFGSVLDPVGIGLVKSLARPVGNVTGMTQSVGSSLLPKRIELLREILPGVKRIELRVDPTDRAAKIDQQEIAPLAASLGLTFIVAEAANPVAIPQSILLRADRVIERMQPLPSPARTLLARLQQKQEPVQTTPPFLTRACWWCVAHRR